MEERYSPIKNILVTNYRNIQKEVFSFEKSPIICLVGENDSGKSSAIMAFTACALNARMMKQKNYIRHGTQFFGVAIELEDGTIIKRLKSETANRYDIEYPDGKVWSTSKISEGLPVQVQELIGIIQEPETKEYLQVRTYRDKMMFVDTPDSTNYKVVYEALKVGQVTRAIKKGTDESNDLFYTISQNRTKLLGLCESEKKIVVSDLTPLTSMRKAVELGVELLKKIDEIRDLIEDIKSTEESLGTLRLIDTFKLNNISEIECLKLNDAYNSYLSCIEIGNKIESIKEVDTVESIDITPIYNLEESMRLIEDINNSNGWLEVYKETEKVEYIDYSVLNTIKETVEILNEISIDNERVKSYNEIKDIDYSGKEYNNIVQMENLIDMIKQNKEMASQIEEIDKYISQSNQYLKDLGVAFEKCPNCGEQVMVDYSKFIN